MSSIAPPRAATPPDPSPPPPSAVAGESAAAGWTCPTCGTASPGDWCPACGERRLDARDRSLRGFAAEAFQSVTSLDSALLRSLRLLVTRPGALTAAHVAGQRRGYVPPLQLFLLCNLAFFAGLTLTGFNTFTTPLAVHLNALPHSPFAQALVEAEIARRGTTLAEYRVAFDRAIGTQAKTLVVVMVPLFALMVQALYGRRRYFVESLAFSFHFCAWMLLVMMAHGGALQVAGAVFRALGIDGWWLLGDVPSTILLAFLLWAYLAVATRAAFGGRVGPAVLRGLALTMTFMVVVQAYRFVLFCTTFLSV